MLLLKKSVLFHCAAQTKYTQQGAGGVPGQVMLGQTARGANPCYYLEKKVYCSIATQSMHNKAKGASLGRLYLGQTARGANPRDNNQRPSLADELYSSMSDHLWASSMKVSLLIPFGRKILISCFVMGGKWNPPFFLGTLTSRLSSSHFLKFLHRRFTSLLSNVSLDSTLTPLSFPSSFSKPPGYL